MFHVKVSLIHTEIFMSGICLRFASNNMCVKGKVSRGRDEAKLVIS